MTQDNDDLAVLARRGALSETERRRLRDLLASSEEARWLDAAGRGFDAETPILAGDDALIEQMVQRVERGKRATRGPGRLRFGRWLAVGLLAAGVSVAAVKLSPSLFGTSEKKVEPAPEAFPKKIPALGHDVSSAPVPAVESTTQVVDAPAPPPAAALGEPPPRPPVVAGRPAASSARPAARDDGAQPKTAVTVAGTQSSALPAGAARFEDEAPAPSVAGTTAEELFVAANRARTRGDTAGAIALYRRLRSEFPRSMQASGAGVTLGVLYLQQGQGVAALQVFRTLRAESGGNPSAEVLWDLAQSLRQTRGTAEERSVLEELVQRHPRSAYIAAARKRISELE